MGMNMIIILDTARSVRVLEQMAVANREMPEFAVNVMQTILERLSDRNGAMLCLKGFVENVRMGNYLNGEDSSDEIDSFYYQAIEEIGCEIFDQLQSLKLYDEKGKLQLEFYIPDMSHYPSDVMLWDPRKR